MGTQLTEDGQSVVEEAGVARNEVVKMHAPIVARNLTGPPDACPAAPAVTGAVVDAALARIPDGGHVG
jgi:hypothetical protein